MNKNDEKLLTHFEKAEYIFLNEFKNGIITKFTLERP